MTKKAIVIRKNEYDEYELPTEWVFFERCEVPGDIYYTDDKDDAIDTARFHYGDDVRVSFRNGTYTPE